MLGRFRAFTTGLHFRFLSLVVGIATALLLAQLVTDTASEFRKVRERRISDALSVTSVIARSLEKQFDLIELTDIETILASVRQRPDVTQLTVVDRDLTFYLDGDPMTSPIASFHQADVQLRALKSGKTEHGVSSEGIEVGEPLLSNGTAIGAVFIKFRNAGFTETIAPIVRAKLMTVAPILVAGILFAMGLVSQITLPLRNLSRAAKSVAEGDLNQTLNVHGAREIRQLGEAFATMIDQVKANIEQIYQLAYVDRITKLPNREYFRNELTRAINRAQRTGITGALLFVDLDGFKRVNDTLGHDQGDKLLKAFAERISKLLRAEDTITWQAAPDDTGSPADKVTKQVLARLGGDEFTVLLSEIREETDAALVARRIISAMETPFDINGTLLHLGASVGIATFPRDGANYQDLLKSADLAMYQAKREGKGTYHFFSSELNDRVSHRLRIENDLREALEKDELELFFQPKVKCADNSVDSVEALVRWRHPVRGLVNPGEFISIAEETGLILPLGDWVLKDACRQISRFMMQGLDLSIAVNISAQQFERADFADTVLKAVHDAGIEASRLELEITESMTMSDPLRALEHIRQLKRRGIRFAIDDFGTGYSNLSQLSRLPFDVFKIDRSFIEALSDPSDENARVIVRSILALAKSLQYETVAEGVETEEQLELLRSEGCSHVQGFLFCKPMPVAAFVDWLAIHRGAPAGAMEEIAVRKSA